MMERLTKRYIISSLNNINVNNPIRYERYYITNNLRIQNKNGILEKELLNDENVLINKIIIDLNEFNMFKEQSYSKIIRESYLYLDDNRVSIKKYFDNYEGLYRVEVKFSSKDEMDNYQKENWMGNDITNSLLAFDKDLSKLDREEFLIELDKYLK